MWDSELFNLIEHKILIRDANKKGSSCAFLSNALRYWLSSVHQNQTCFILVAANIQVDVEAEVFLHTGTLLASTTDGHHYCPGLRGAIYLVAASA